MALYTHIKGPVKYTVVGSPTIEDGVASGFSANDFVYAILGSAPAMTDIIELGIAVTPSSIKSCGLFGRGNAYYAGIYINSAGKPFVRYQKNSDNSALASSVTSDVTMQNNIKYYIKMLKTVDTLSISVSTDNSTWITNSTGIDTSDILTFGLFNIGYGNSAVGGVLNGSIDLNHTYITVNGLPRFGSCPVRAKFRKDKNTTYTLHSPDYLVRDNKLVWANPKLYLNNNNNLSAFINTNIPGSYFQGKTVISHFAFLRTVDNNPFGLLDTSNGSRVEFGIGWDASAYSANYGNVGIKCVNTVEINKKVEIKFTPASGTINSISVFDGETYAGNISDWGVFSRNTTRTCYLLASNRQTGFRAFGGKLYDFVIADGDTQLYHFVPVPAGLKIGDYTVPANGMWDMVNQKYYGNAGSGEFKIGKDI